MRAEGTHSTKRGTHKAYCDLQALWVCPSFCMYGLHVIFWVVVTTHRNHSPLTNITQFTLYAHFAHKATEDTKRRTEPSPVSGRAGSELESSLSLRLLCYALPGVQIPRHPDFLKCLLWRLLSKGDLWDKFIHSFSFPECSSEQSYHLVRETHMHTCYAHMHTQYSTLPVTPNCPDQRYQVLSKTKSNSFSKCHAPHTFPDMSVHVSSSHLLS